MLENFESYLLKERRYSTHTVDAYLIDIDAFLKFAEVDNVKGLDQINYQVIRAWMVNLMEDKLIASSIHRKLSSLRTFFKWLKLTGQIDHNPTAKIKAPKKKKRLPVFVKESDISSDKTEPLFSQDFPGKRDHVLLELLYQTGIRLSECIQLLENDVYNNQIKVLGKRSKERLVPISSELYSLIQEYIHLKNMTFPNSRNLLVTDKGQVLYPKFVYRKVKMYLTYLTSLDKKSPHILRHSFATHMLNNGASIESIKGILGHANLSATQVYTHNSFRELKEIYKKTHPRGS